MTEHNGSEQSGTERTRPARKAIFATREEANTLKPKGDKRWLVEGLKDGQSRGFAWGVGVNEAIVTAARQDGYAATVADSKSGGPMSKERLAAELAEFTDDELAAMGLVRKKGKK